jgi:hypothetical protein
MAGTAAGPTVATRDGFAFNTVAPPPQPEVYDHPGVYAQRFDGLEPAGAASGDIEPVTDPGGNLWLCRTDAGGNYSECIPWP